MKYKPYLTEEQKIKYAEKTRQYLASKKGIEQQAFLKSKKVKEIERKIHAIIAATKIVHYEKLWLIYEELTGSFFSRREE